MVNHLEIKIKFQDEIFKTENESERRNSYLFRNGKTYYLGVTTSQDEILILNY